MRNPDQVIQLSTHKLVIKVVDNENGVLVQLVTASDNKTIDATLMVSAHTPNTVIFIDKKPVLEYRCTDCQAEFTNEQAGSYCPDCGHDEVMYIPDLEEDEA